MRLAVSAVVGVAVGYFSGNPYLGFQAFAATYGTTGFLDPNKKVLGPKLKDLKAPKADYGAPIAYIEGAPRIAGNYIWASDKRAVANESSTDGKGGPGVDSTTFTYEMDVLIELAINRCQAIRRIWSNGKLVWSSADDADHETIAASTQTTSWRDLRFYDGSPDQLPDPTYEAAVGVGNAPAYRTRTTVFIEGLNLGQSGQLPILTFEVLSEAADTVDVEELVSFPALLLPFALGTPAYSLTEPFDVFAVGSNEGIFSGYIYSFDVYTIDPVTGNMMGGPGAHFDIGQHFYESMLGNADEGLFIVRQGGVGGAPWDVYATDGAQVTIDLSEQASAATRFSKVGDDLVVLGVGNSVSTAPNNDGKLRRFSRATGAQLAIASTALPGPCWSVAIGGAYVYSLSYDGSTLYKSSLSTLALVDTIAIPAAWNAYGGFVMCDGDVPYVMGSGTAAWQLPLIRWNGASWDLVGYGNNATIFPHDPPPIPGLIDLFRSPYGQMNFVDGTLFSQGATSAGPGDNESQIRFMSNRVAIGLPTLDQVVRRLCLRTKQLTDDDINVTALASQVVRSMAVTQVSPTRATLESLMAAHLFEWAEADKLRAVPRGGASVVTIPYADLGVSDDGTEEPLPKKRSNDMEQVARVSVRYSNVLNDSQDGVEQADRLVTQSQAEAVVEVPLGFTPTEAKRLADANTMDEAVRLIQLGPVSLSRKYAHLEVGDVFTVTDFDGSTFRVRAVRGTIGGGANTFELLLDDATAISSVAETDDSYVSSTLIRLLSDTELEMLDIPILRDVDDSLGPYAAFDSTGPRWRGAQLDKSSDDISFAKVGAVTSKTTIGVTTTALGDFAGGTFDELNSVTVDVGDGTLSSYTRDAALAGSTPAYLVGSEIVIACTATLVSPGVYTLTRLLRGLRGTEWAMADHESGERVVLLQEPGLLKVADGPADFAATRYYRATSIGKSTADAEVETFVDTGVAKKPFAPVDLRLDRSGGDIVVNWHRRSRLASRFLAQTQPPLGEAAESYDVELYDGATLVDAQTVTSPSYSAAQLIGGDFVNAPIWGGRVLGGQLVAVREEAPESVTVPRYVARLDSAGAFIDQSSSIGQRVFQLANIGDAIYAAVEFYASTVPTTTILSSKVLKLTRTTLGTVDATYTSGTLGDPAGLVSDGSNIWISERLSNQLRKLHPTTLASVATYAMASAPTGIFYAAGKIWVACWGSDQIARFDVATLAEDLRFSCVTRPGSVVVTGSFVFVVGESAVASYNATTGALIQVFPHYTGTNLPQRQMAIFGSSVVALVYVTGSPYQKVAFYSGTTGQLEALMAVPSPFALLAFIGGVDGTDLLLCGSRLISGGSYETRRFSIASLDLAGFTLRVYQNSAVVGRGYPATLEL